MHKLWFLFLAFNGIALLSMDPPVTELHDFKKLVRSSLDSSQLLVKPVDDGEMFAQIIKDNDHTVLKNMLTSDCTLALAPAMHTAAAWGRVECTRILLEHGADPNGTTEKGDTPLHYAKTVKTAKFLLENGARIDAKNKKGKTPLYKALFCHRRWSLGRPYKSQGLYIAELLIYSHANINAVDKNGDSLLHCAVEKDNLAAAEFLLSNNINAKKTNKKNLTALELLILSEGSSPMFTVFEKYGMFFFSEMTIADLSHEVLSIDWTAENIFYRPDDVYINKICRLFSCLQSYDKMRASFKDGLFFNQHGCVVQNLSKEDLQNHFTPTVFKKISKNVRFLRTEMESYFRENHVSGLEILLGLFPWLAHNNPALTYWMMRNAIEKKYHEILKILLRTKIDVSQLISFDHRINKEGAGHSTIFLDRLDRISFLHLAVLHGNDAAIRLLVKYNADCLQKNSKQQTPLQYAIELGRKECAEVLNTFLCELCASSYRRHEYRKSKQYLHHIINVNSPLDRKDNTLLHAILAEQNHKKTLQFLPLLIAKGADVNRCNNKKCMPLDYVSVSDSETLPIFKILLEAKADIRFIGSTLLGTALYKGDSEKIRLFLKYGAIVRKEHLAIETSPEIAASLKQKYKEQQCCVCLENPGDLSCIACSCKHSEFLCQGCNSQLDMCPLCRGILLK